MYIIYSMMATLFKREMFSSAQKHAPHVYMYPLVQGPIQVQVTGTSTRTSFSWDQY